MGVEFYPLVTHVRPETDQAVVLTFSVPDDLRAVFRHTPGQHVVLRAVIDGHDVRRSYSICSSPADDRFAVAIKRIPGGIFSTWATTELADGDVLEVMPPIGEFTHEVQPQRAGRYVAVAAGSGITPLLSIVTTVLEDEPDSSCTLVYGNRTTASVMFLEEIEALKNHYTDRLSVVHTLSREPHEVPLFEGRIDAAKMRLLAGSLIEPSTVDGWYLCGPLEMVETVTSTLVDELGVNPSTVHQELFFDQRIDAAVAERHPAGSGVSLAITLGGRTSTVLADPDGPSVLDYARTVRSDVPFACKGGMCATCKAQVTAGKVRMVKNYALTAGEIEAGYVLTCQAHPLDGDVAVTFDTTSR